MVTPAQNWFMEAPVTGLARDNPFSIKLKEQLKNPLSRLSYLPLDLMNYYIIPMTQKLHTFDKLLLKACRCFDCLHIDNKRLSSEQIVRIIQVSQAEMISLDHLVITDTIMQALKLTDTHEIMFFSCTIEAEELDFSNFKTLKDIRLIQLKRFTGNINTMGITSLYLSITLISPGKLILDPNIQVFNSNGSNWSNGFECDFTELTSLSLSDCTDFPTNAPIDLSKASKLEYLSITLENWKGPLTLPPAGKLREVTLRCPSLTTSDRHNFSEHPELLSLIFDRCKNFNSSLLFGPKNNQLQVVNFIKCHKRSQVLNLSWKIVRIIRKGRQLEDAKEPALKHLTLKRTPL